MKQAKTFQSRHYPESLFGGYTNVDGTIVFYTRVNCLLPAVGNVLNVGCGRGRSIEDPVEYRATIQDLRGPTRRVLGIDVDNDARGNPTIDEFRLIAGSQWPVESASIDFAICDHVLEHIEDPKDFFTELSRVSKPGAIFCARTPSRWGYVSLISRVVPESFHPYLLRRGQPDRLSNDVFPTFYRANTPKKLKLLLAGSSFGHHAVYSHEAEPSYFAFSSVLYALGVLHQKIAVSPFRLSLHCFARKLE